MHEEIDEIGGHRGVLELTGRAETGGCQCVCDCGWRDSRWFGRDERGRSIARERWARHAIMAAEAQPPQWLVARSTTLREQITELITKNPPAALALLADIDSWHGELLGKAVATARTGGASWADIGDYLGMTRQAAHERFRGLL